MTQGKYREWTLDDIRQRCEEVGECWLWLKSVNSGGHPTCSHNGSTVLAKRLAYSLTGKRLPTNGMLITARCGNVLCCSPSCLMSVTRSRLQELSHARRRRDDPEYWAKVQKTSQFAKVNRAIAEEMRASGDDMKTLSKRYGMSEESARRILRNESWHQPARVSSVFAWRP